MLCKQDDPVSVVSDALESNRLLQAQVFLAATRVDTDLHVPASTARRALAMAFALAARGDVEHAAAVLGSAGMVRSTG